MNRTISLLLILFVLMGIWFYTKQDAEKKTTIRIEDREFITKDREAISTITIDSKGRPRIHLEKKEGEWYINNKYLAKFSIVNNMLSTLSRMAIDYIPTQGENKTALKRMEKHGIDITTYDEAGKVLTEFTLGTNTNDEYGTFCLKKGAKQTYVMSIPTQEGGIREYFNQTVIELRDRLMFDLKPDEIKEIKVEFPKDKKSSFLINNESAVPQVKPLIERQMQGKLSRNILDAYIKDFHAIYAEAIKNDFQFRDSITVVTPFMELTILSTDGKERHMKMFPHLDAHNQYYNTKSVDDLHNRHERFYVETNWGDFYLCQDRFIGRFMRKVDYFYR